MKCDSFWSAGTNRALKWKDTKDSDAVRVCECVMRDNKTAVLLWQLYKLLTRLRWKWKSVTKKNFWIRLAPLRLLYWLLKKVEIVLKYELTANNKYKITVAVKYCCGQFKSVKTRIGCIYEFIICAFSDILQYWTIRHSCALEQILRLFKEGILYSGVYLNMTTN